jgi:hypothetical protein
MDFITRGDRDLKHTEIFYGKKSDQYALHSLLLDAENTLKTTGFLVLGKQCKQEYITITFYIMSHINDGTIKKVKTHWNKEKTEIRKVKEKVLNKSISSLVDNDVYDLILNNGYKLEA